MQSVADALAEGLVVNGVEVVFGLPGGENMEVLDAIRDHDIDFVLVHNESSAVFIADAYARLTGKPGVCLTTLGPGAANATVGLAHAYLDRSPVLLITAQSNPDLIGRHTHQVIDLHALFSPITKLTTAVTTDRPGEMVRDALALAMQGRPGPVHLSVSNEQAAVPISEEDRWSAERSAPLAEPAESDILRALDLLAQAQRPLIVCGLGLEPEKPYAELRLLAEALGAPVIVTPKAKGALPADHPLYAGAIGLTRTDPVYELLDEADSVLAVGFDVVELVKPWDCPSPLIWIAPWANEDPTIAAGVELVGVAGPVLARLAASQSRTESGWGSERVRLFREKLSRVPLPSPAPGRMRPQSVLSAVRANTPRDLLIATDVGSHKILTALDWPAYAPNRYLVSNGLSAMGFGVSAAIAAAYTLREPVVVVTGDAGLAMVMGELATARRLGLPVIVVVMNDSALDLIRSAQVRKGKPIYGTEFTNPDFANIAAAYDIGYYRVADEQGVAAAIEVALDTGKTALIDALIDPSSYPTTPAL